MARARQDDDGAVVLDAMCGGGVRAVRYALEVPGVARALATDLDPGSVEVAKRTVELSTATSRVEVRRGNRNFMRQKLTLDVLKVDVGCFKS